MLTTRAFQAGLMAPNQTEVSPMQLASLLGRRKFGEQETEENPFNPQCPVPSHLPEDMRELQDYCKKMGIIGVNFGGMHPKAVLQMLKNKTGFRGELNEMKKELLHG